MTAAAVGIGTVAQCAAAGNASAQPPLSIASQGYFFVGGHYVKTADGQAMVGQMYVQYQIPAKKRHPYPIVMIHGGRQTGTNFLATPDGREGWATYFLRQGYSVYVVDQPARGRSGFVSDVYKETRKPSTEDMAQSFTDPQAVTLYPQAKLHTQWPGKGEPGDPVFDQFFASQVEDIADVAEIERLNRAAGAALLDRIGPAILITHSQSGPIGWGLGNDRPDKVKAIIAIEPNGPPFYGIQTVGPPAWFKDGTLNWPYGITRTPLTYDPPINDPAELKPVRDDKPGEADGVRCWAQSAPAHRLPRLAQLRILMLGSEASYHSTYDYCTSNYLTQAGIRHDFVRLADVGIRGNGHMMMLEKNNMEIADFMRGWIEKNVR